MLDDQSVRLQCLDLAMHLWPSEDPVGAAERFYAFVMGQSAKTPKEIILDALAAAGVS